MDVENENREQIRAVVLASLESQGFILGNGRLVAENGNSKDASRLLHTQAVTKKIKNAEGKLKRFEPELVRKYIATGEDINPEKFDAYLVEVTRKSELEILFRYVYTHWAIPVSPGYGRRIRYLVFDRANSKLVGIMGLCDPVYSLTARDKWIGWDAKTKKEKLCNVMDAFVLGAVPPYSNLLCGKLMAMLTLSAEVGELFEYKYGESQSKIYGMSKNPRLALVTTTSALGRSSVYNRLHINGQKYLESVGYTKGYGEFHFSNGTYGRIFEFVNERCAPMAKNAKWGTGWRNKREVIKRCLQLVGLPDWILCHGVNREIFCGRRGFNSLEFLRGENDCLDKFMWTAEELSEKFKQRWLLKRASSDSTYLSYENSQYRLWP